MKGRDETEVFFKDDGERCGSYGCRKVSKVVIKVGIAWTRLCPDCAVKIRNGLTKILGRYFP
jgi:hypothetical protein